MIINDPPKVVLNTMKSWISNTCLDHLIKPFNKSKVIPLKNKTFFEQSPTSNRKNNRNTY